MGTTPTYALPYPELTDPADISQAVRPLADRIEALWAGGTTPGLPNGTVTYQPLTWSGTAWTKGDRIALSQNYLDAISLTGPAGGILFGSDIYLARESSLYLGLSQSLKTGKDVVARSGFGGGANTAQVRIGQTSVSGFPAGIEFGSAVDANLYRYQANVLATDGAFYYKGTPSGVGAVFLPATAAGNALATLVSPGDTQYRYGIDVNGKMTWGTGAVAGDTNLYRDSANVLATDDQFWIKGAGGLKFPDGTTMTTATVGGGGGPPTGAAGGDLYGSYPNPGVARSSTIFTLGVTSDITSMTPALRSTASTHAGFGITQMANRQHLVIYGYSSSYIAQFAAKPYTTTPDVAWDASAYVQLTIDQAGGLTWGSARDTNLYRGAAGILQTDGKLAFGGTDAWIMRAGAATLGVRSFFIDLNTEGYKLYFGNAADTNLYRPAASTLKTDGTFQVVGHLYAGWTGTGYALIANANGNISASYGSIYGKFWYDPTIWIGAGSMLPITGNAASNPTPVYIGSTDMYVVDCADAANTGAQFNFPTPKDFPTGGTFQARAIWMSQSVNTGAVRWGFDGQGLINGNVVTGPPGGAQFVTSSNAGANILNISAWSPAITLNVQPGPLAQTFMRVYRQGTDGADTHTATARLIGVELKYTKAVS